MMRKNTGRRKVGTIDESSGWETDGTWKQYREALPGTISHVATKVGVSTRRAERSLGILRNLKLIQRDGEIWSAVDQQV